MEINAMNAASKNCPTVTSKIVELCVPISVSASAKVGKIVTKCCGKPTIKPGKVCEGERNGECNFTIKQKICIEVPVEFASEAKAGDTFVKCGKSSNDSNCDKLCKESNNDDDNQDEDNK